MRALRPHVARMPRALNLKACEGRVDPAMRNFAGFEYMGYHWSVLSELAESLRTKVIPLALAGEESPHLRVVGRKPARDSLIVSVDDSSTDIFVKIHKYDKLRERIKSILIASRAEAEFKIAEQMHECGLPVAEPLGFGERRTNGLVTGCVLLLQTITGCMSLSRYLLKEYSAESFPVSKGQNEFLRSLGALIRKMHSAGFRHPDLHTANILVNSEHSPPKLWLVDLHSVTCSPDVSRRGRMADMAKMVFSLRSLLDEHQLCEVLSGYDPEATGTEIKTNLSKLSAAADSIGKRRIRSRAKRCLKTSGSFVVERIADKKMYRRREFESDIILNIVKRHHETRAVKGPELIKSTHASFLTSFPLSNVSGENVYVKEFTNRGIVRLLEKIFYIHRGKRAWKAGHLLRILGVPCAEPVALVEEGKFGLMRNSYLIMKEIPDADRLDVFLLNRFFRSSGRLTKEEILEKRNLLREGACALKEFHAKKVYHKDLSAKNLLVNPDCNGDLRFYWVDLDSIEFPLRLSMRRRIKNLAQLNGVPSCIKATDKVRFYMEYFGLQTLDPKHKMFIKIILRISRRRFRLSRQADQRIRDSESSGAETYEDTPSL